MIDRIIAPWADIRFRGYLRGRSSLTLSLKQRGFSLQVHPALGFVVHRSHDQTRAQVSDLGFRQGLKWESEEQWDHPTATVCFHPSGMHSTI